MQITGVIYCVCPEKAGTSRSGNQWKSREYVLETQEQYPKKIAFTLFNDKIDKFDAMLRVGANVSVDVDIESREYQGKWYTSVTAWRVNSNEAQIVQPNPALQPQDPIATYPQYTQQPIPSPSIAQGVYPGYTHPTPPTPPPSTTKLPF